MSTHPHLRHALSVVLGFTVLFAWLLSGSLFSSWYLAQSDLYEYFLPIFLAPLRLWSSYEFGGIPTFADAADDSVYPVHLLVARVLHVWEVLPLAAYVMAACFTYAYVLNLTRSPRAAAVSGLAYSLSEPLVGRLPHMGFLHALAWFPFLLLCVDRVREGSAGRWVALGGFGFACFFLAGHPQPVVYGLYVIALYAIVGGYHARAPKRYYVAVAAMVVLGVLIAAIKAVPVIEATGHMARQFVSFGQFAGSARLNQTATLLFPTAPHDPLEMPFYMGIVPVLLAFLANARRGNRWPLWFWTCVAIFALTIAFGDATPLAQAAYHLPLYDKFRIATRHLFLAAFAVAVVAGMALAAIESGGLRATRLFATVGILAAVIVVVGANAFQLPAPHVSALDLGIQAALLAGTAGCVLALSRPKTRHVAATVLSALVIVDLLHAAPYPLRRSGIDAPVIPPRAAHEPSVHAERLASNMAAQGQRLLALSGTHVDAVVPAAFARVWQIPIAGGYGPMLLDRHKEMALMGTNGAASPEVLAPDDSALDILAVRYVLIRKQDYPPQPPLTAAGLTWDPAPLEWSIGRADCGFPYPRRSTLALPRLEAIKEVALVAYMRCAEDVPQGTTVATLEAIDGSGSPQTLTLRAGENIADRLIDEPSVAPRAKHRPVERAASGYVVRWNLERPARLTHLSVDATGFGGWIVIDRVTLVDEHGAQRALGAPWIYLADRSRWREVETIRTSRTSDRGRDEDAAGESDVTVFENLRARPRAWVVPEIAAMSQGDMIAAVHQGQLPDGRRFDPARIALVDEQPGETALRNSTGGTTRVVEAGSGRMTVDVETEHGGFLVLSEAFYPGWTARSGDRDLPVRRANLSLQGVTVPAGRHTVVFEFKPTSFRIGAALSIAGLGAVLVLLLRTRGV